MGHGVLSCRRRWSASRSHLAKFGTPGDRRRAPVTKAGCGGIGGPGAHSRGSATGPVVVRLFDGSGRDDLRGQGGANAGDPFTARRWAAHVGAQAKGDRPGAGDHQDGPTPAAWSAEGVEFWPAFDASVQAVPAGSGTNSGKVQTLSSRPTWRRARL